MMNWIPDQPVIVEDTSISPLVFIDASDTEEPPYPSTLLPLVNTMWQIAAREGTPFAPDGVWNPFGTYR
jgi:hypothetical protein